MKIVPLEEKLKILTITFLPDNKFTYETKGDLTSVSVIYALERVKHDILSGDSEFYPEE